MSIEMLRRLQPLRTLPLAVQYGATMLIALAFFGLRYLLAGLDLDPGQLPLFLFFMPAVVLAAFLFDRGSGYVAVLVSAALGLYFLVDPNQPFVSPDGDGLVRIVSFLVIGFLTAAIIQMLARSFDQAASRLADIARAHDGLERRAAALKAADAQKELLLHDINHRIKNQLQVVAGYISLGQRDVADDQAAQVLGSAANRLKVLARVYDRLQLGRETTSVGARGFIEEMVNDLQPGLIGVRPIVLRAEAEVAELSSGRAVTIGLMINELVSNAVRFAFAEDEAGTILVIFRRCEGGFCLEVIDDGRGFRSEARSGSVGQRMLRALVAQLEGTIEWAGPPGTRVSVAFPEESQPQDRTK
ncbi:MAG TPA: histidine kinase dimerization/phosphoacceptor domain -containing protein [Allosphingosinicella sp.]|jgi:two-component sensor histidine kinase